MDINKNAFLSINQLANRYLEQSPGVTKRNDVKQVSFHEVLKKTNGEQQKLHFSKHATGRLAERNISLTQDQMERLNGGARKACEKGIKDSLVIVDKLAFIVNVPSHTVVTAMDSTETTDKIFTNINGAVIM